MNTYNNTYTKKLSYFLQEDGSHYLEFKEWLSHQILDTHTNLELDLYCKKLENTKLLTNEQHKIIFQKIKTSLETYIINHTHNTPFNIFLAYITTLDKYCFQGGNGHHVYYKYINNNREIYSPHHWMISPETYKIYSDIPYIITLCATICEFYIRIEEHPTQAYWSG
jgi:hypothetical protein